MLILLILLILLFGGGFYGRNAGWEGPQFGGLLGVVLVVLLVLFLLGRL